MFRIIRLIAVLGSGLLAGIYLADRAMADARVSLDPSSFIAFQQTVHVTYVRMMPILLITAIVATILWLILIRQKRRTVGFWLAAASLVGLFSIVAVTASVNVPLNNELMTWNAAAPPANLMTIWAPWERIDGIRTVICIAVFFLQAANISFSGNEI